MIEPEKETAKNLLQKVHCDGVLNWTIKEQADAYEQLKRLYEHWFREEILCCEVKDATRR